MSRQGGLGRGLDALLPSAAEGQAGLRQLRLGEIVPNRRQPRGEFDEQGIEELAQSLQRVGMLQPILVRSLPDGRYELIAGERRLRAARVAGLDEVPAIVRTTGDDELLTEALVENIHRIDLNPLEEAAGMQQLLDDFGLTHEELADRLGKSRPAITNTLRLLSLSPAIQQRIASGTLRPGHARALLSVKDAATQERIAQRVVAEGLSVRATEELARRAEETTTGSPGPSSGKKTQGKRSPEGETRRSDGVLAHLSERLEDAWGTRVRIDGSVERGRIVVEFSGREDLERLLRLFADGAGEELVEEAQQ